MRLSGRKPSSFTRRWTQDERFVLLALIACNLLAYAVQVVLERYHPGITRLYLGLSKAGIDNAYGWQFFTAAFLHAGPWHLVGSVLLLYVIGRDVESILGQRHFFLLYAAGAVGGELGHLLLMPTGTVLLGASGGVAAILSAFATILPELELTALVFFVLPIRIKTKHLSYGAITVAGVFVILDRHGVVSHSAYLGGCAAGWLYAHLLGFGRPSFLQRALRQRRAQAERLRRMSPEQFVAEEVDPLLEKISRAGLPSLTRRERKILAQASAKMSGS